MVPVVEKLKTTRKILRDISRVACRSARTKRRDPSRARWPRSPLNRNARRARCESDRGCPGRPRGFLFRRGLLGGQEDQTRPRSPYQRSFLRVGKSIPKSFKEIHRFSLDEGSRRKPLYFEWLTYL